jgi:hypothetical protein
LRHVQSLGGARDIVGAGDGGKNFKLAQGESHID